MQEWQLTPAGTAWRNLTDAIAEEFVEEDDQKLRACFAPGFVFKFSGQPDADEDGTLYFIGALQEGCTDWMEHITVDEPAVVVSDDGLTIRVPYVLKARHDRRLELPDGRSYPVTDKLIEFNVTDTVTVVIDEEGVPRATSWTQDFNTDEVFSQFESAAAV